MQTVKEINGAVAVLPDERALEANCPGGKRHPCKHRPIHQASAQQIGHIQQILDEHPRLTREAIHAALAFAMEALRADRAPFGRYPVAEAVA